MFFKRISGNRLFLSLYLACVASFAGGIAWANCPSLVVGSQAEPYYGHACLDGYACGGYCCCILICASPGCSSQTQNQSCASPGVCLWASTEVCRGEVCS